MANGLFRGGTGTEQDPYLVEDAADLFMVASHYSGEMYQGVNYSYLQVQDIDLVGENFKPIGDISQGPPFMGNYDGGGYAIKNLSINNETSTGLGLFGMVSGSILRNIKIVGANIVGTGNNQRIGLLAGTCDGANIENCQLEGNLSSDIETATIGGIAGAAINAELYNCLINAQIEGVGNLRGFSGEGYGCTIVNCLVKSSIKILAEGIADVHLFCSSYSDSVIENCLVLTNIDDIFKAYHFDIWGKDTSGTGIIRNSISGAENAFNLWNDAKEYPYGSYVVGTDGSFYKNFRPQEVNPTEYETERPLNVRPVSGEDWQVYWELVDDASLVSNGQLKEPSTFVGWDFENTWVMGKNGPELKSFYSPSEEIPDDNNDTPSDIVIVTDVNFSKTKLIRDAFGSPIPQVWDHENKRYVPVTLQMVLFMANS